MVLLHCQIKVVKLTPNRMKLRYIILISAVVAICTSCSKSSGIDKKEQADKVVGIAWREDSDKEGFTDVVCSFNSIGIKAVLLPQVVDYDITYNGNKVSSECIDANGILKQEWADLVKKNTYSNSNVASAVNNVIAVVFTGGEDIAPTLYRVPQAWHGPEKDKEFNATRDISDYLLMSYSIDKDIPLMGICRGCQLLGIVSGATMIQDIPSWFAAQDIKYDYIHRPEDTASEDSDYVPHDVTAVPGSRLAEFTGTTTINNVPSWHHQCLSTVDGNCLKVTGTTFTNGFDFIEAIERTDRSLAIGLQFHPEVSIVKHVNKSPNESNYMNYTKAQSIFRNFVNKSCEIIQGRVERPY